MANARMNTRQSTAQLQFRTMTGMPHALPRLGLAHHHLLPGMLMPTPPLTEPLDTASSAPSRAQRKRNTLTSAANPSRLHPLQMMSRHTASKAATVSTRRSVGSVDGSQNSFDNSTQLERDLDIDADRPTKKARLSDRSSSTRATKTVVKHQRNSTPEVNDSNQDKNIPDIVATPDPPHFASHEDGQLAGDESVADERLEDDVSIVQDFLAPVPRQSGRKQRIRRAETPTGSVADSLLLGTPLNGDHGDVDLEAGTDQDIPKAARRLPGRRRAPVSDPVLEAALRRQLQLRMGHRAVSKALKPVLIELARRTAMQLDRKSIEIEEEFLELEKQLTAKLSTILEARVQIIENECRVSTSYHDTKYQADQEYQRMQYKVCS